VQNARVEVEDRDGWRKTFAIQKAITHIGSEARNDIVLETWRGVGVAPRHAQIIGAGAGYRLVNIGNAEIVVAPGPDSSDAPLAPLSATELRDGALIRLGDFRLRFFMPAEPQLSATGAPAGAVAMTFSASNGMSHAASLAAAPGNDIGLRLQLSGSALTPDRPLEGALVVRNQGSRAGAQFRLEVAGLEPDMFEIGPGPILFPGAEKEVMFRVIHTRRPRPPAGALTMTIRATAPDAYPGQSATVTHTIQVLPYHSHSLTLAEVPDAASG
jgi:predicted component of type VI protein secretion system